VVDYMLQNMFFPDNLIVCTIDTFCVPDLIGCEEVKDIVPGIETVFLI
jgi:hypothetical protein